MAKIIDKKGREHDADTTIRAFLMSKGRNKKERAALIAEYEYGSDMSSWVEHIIAKHGITFGGEMVDSVRQN